MPKPSSVEEIIGSGPFTRLKNSTTWILVSVVSTILVAILLDWYEESGEPLKVAAALSLAFVTASYVMKEGMVRSAQYAARPDKATETDQPSVEI